MLFAAEEVFAAKDDGSAPANEASAAKDDGSAPAEEASAAKDDGSAPAEGFYAEDSISCLLIRLCFTIF